MHTPHDAKPLPFPVHLKPYWVAHFRSTREQLRGVFGAPHYVETDSTRTAGGDEDNWAWELPTGQRVLIVLAVPYQAARVLSDPPDAEQAVAAVGIDLVEQQLQLLAKPFLDPCYSDELPGAVLQNRDERGPCAER